MAEIDHPREEGRPHRPPLRDTAAHEHLIAEAEAKRVLRALSPFGILSRDALAHECHAASWHDGGFSAAVSAAIAAGMIEELPGGFYRDVRHLG